MSRPSGVTRGAFALGAAAAVSKVLGAMQRLLVARWLGAETMGLLELALPVLGAGTNLVGMGVPVGLTVWAPAALARGDAAEAVRLRRAAERLLLVAAAAGTLLLALAAPTLARWLGDPAAGPILTVLAPTLGLSVVLAGRRAWHTATGHLARVAASNVVEQLTKVVGSLALALAFIAATAPAAATALAVAPAAGAAAALLLLGRPSRTAERARLPHLRRLLATGLPTWAATTFIGAMAAVDPALILWRLRVAGHSLAAATALLGELLGMAMPLATACLTLYGAIAAALLPAVAAARALQDRPALLRRLDRAYLWAAAAGVPAAAALSALARPICGLLYHDPGAGTPLTVLAWVAVPLAFSTIAATALTGLGAPEAQLPPLLAGTAIRTGLIVALTVPLGTRGVAWAALAGWTVTAVGNLAAVARRAGIWPRVGPLLLGPGAAAAVLLLITGWVWAVLTRGGTPESLAVVAALGAGGLGAGAWMLPRLLAGRPR